MKDMVPRDGIIVHKFNKRLGSFCSMRCTVHPFYWRTLKKTILFSGFQNPYKKYAKQGKSTLFLNRIL
jgi:hypothetical protein